MLSNRHATGRFALYFALYSWFLVSSSVLRIALMVWQWSEMTHGPAAILRTLATGFFFDMGTGSLLLLPALLYFSLLPDRLVGSLADRAVTYFFSVLTLFVTVFTFFAEVTFWEEFRSRFNFIAVDYLIYTHEVVANIEQSYPLPLLIAGVAMFTVALFVFLVKLKVYRHTFASCASLASRLKILLGVSAAAAFFVFFIPNKAAEWSSNRYHSEISKAGIYSFFAAMRNNRMDYERFYTTIGRDKAFRIVRDKLKDNVTGDFPSSLYSIQRPIGNPAADALPKNVVFILTESLSARFMEEFGNDEKITPFLDSLAQHSLFFSNMYATGTRTVRGMEAVTLSIPPTPGQSIVKRPENKNLYTISNIFRDRGYSCNFFYGGDGYFDNMNAYFGGNGFDIYDRPHAGILSDRIATARHPIPDTQVTFENAWGICDEDIFRTMLGVADEKYRQHKPFLNFVMTTSNHRPYTYPEGRIDIPSKTDRQGAVKYTDYAFRQLFREARKKPWFSQTVFVIVADHCASSAGKDEIDVANYHIPAFIVNLPQPDRKIATQCSQIDLFPTLFSQLGWKYRSDFFGKDVLSEGFEPRALFGTYRKLCLMKDDKVMVLSDGKKQTLYRWNEKSNLLRPLPMEPGFLDETISWYQTADYLFSHKLLK